MSGQQKKPQPESTNRSVVHYDTEDALRKALLAVELNKKDNNNNIGGDSCNNNTATAPPVIPAEEESNDAALLDYASSIHNNQNLDWVLTNYDAETTEVQSMKEELKRLQVLKSYSILDSEKEAAFDRITAIASRVFNVPISLVSLVDLGRQWFMSNHGLPTDVRETPRKLAFCAHVILSKNNLLVIPDATKDIRFKDNPLVTSAPNIRFYAGVPLISPEGYKLGTFCIIDDKTRPGGLRMDEIETLRDLADMAVDAMVNRRHKLQSQENPAQLIACTAHDLMTPLTGVQLSLSLLKEDDEVCRRLGDHHLELLTTAATCSDLMIRICKTSMASLRKESAPPAKYEAVAERAESNPVTQMDDLIKSLHLIVEPIPKKVPLIITLDPTVPPVIVGDDLKLFRSALNFLSSAASRTQHGCIQFRIYPKEDNSELIFECEDTGEAIPVEEYQYLYQNSLAVDGSLRLCLSSVASLISSLDGLFGFRPRRATGRHKTGSIFWFSIPLNTPDSLAVDAATGTGASSKTSNMYSRRKDPIVPLIRRNASNSSFSSGGRRKLFVDGIMQKNAVDNSCFRGIFEASVRAEPEGCGKANALFPIPGQISLQAKPYDRRNYEPASGAIAVAPDPLATDRKRKALVVDDSLVVRKSLAMALKKKGFDVSQAVNGLDGLKQLKQTLFDLVLCDFLMPVMDGFDCVKQFRSWEKENRTSFRQYIIGISAHADKHVAAQGIVAGMDAFYPKPIGIKIVSEMLQSKAVIQTTKRLDELELEKKRPAVAANIIDSDSVQEPKLEMKPQPKISNAAANGANIGGFAQNQDTGNKNQDNDGQPLRPPPKRMRTSSTDRDQSEAVCLMATDRPTQTSSEVLTHMQSHGWKVVVVHDGCDALRLLQMRNWDAVLIDDDLPLLAGTTCIQKFRGWEHDNRVNRQKNVFMVSDLDIPSPFDRNAIVQPPCGCDHVLQKPVIWSELKRLLHRSSQDQSMSIILNMKTCTTTGQT